VNNAAHEAPVVWRTSSSIARTVPPATVTRNVFADLPESAPAMPPSATIAAVNSIMFTNGCGRRAAERTIKGGRRAEIGRSATARRAAEARRGAEGQGRRADKGIRIRPGRARDACGVRAAFW